MPGAAGLPFGLGDHVEDGLAVRGVALAGTGGDDAPGTTVQQFGLQPVFQQRDQARNLRLGHAHVVGGGREAAAVHHMHERVHRMQ